MTNDLDELTQKWNLNFPDTEPRVDSLKSQFQDRWIRLYSLPGAKRYPETPEETRNIIDRYFSILSELSGSSDSLQTITCEWTVSPAPLIESTILLPPEQGGVYWMSLDERLHDADAETYRHLYVRQVNMRDPWLKDLLLKVIEDETAGVIMTSQSVEWLFHPYDGGMDIIANSPFERNKLAEKYKNWSS